MKHIEKTWRHRELANLVPLPGQLFDWASLCNLIPALLLLEDTPQDPIHHAEGNVGIHTRMVLECLLDDPHYASVSQESRFVLFVAALLHDISKPDTTVIDELTGRIGQPGHSRRGAVDVRVMLWRAGTPIALREAVCRLIAVHQTPFHAFSSRRGESPEYIARKLSWELALPDLACVARADMRGRITDNQKSHLADIELFEELAREDGCWEGPRQFADAHTAVSYFRGTQLHPEQALHQAPGSKVTVMCGLPASGKNTWVSRHRPGLAVVSYDDAREELELRHGKNEGRVAHYAVDKARELLRRKEPFVWNATHLSLQLRQKAVDLAFAYGAEVEIVHLEQTLEVLLQRNAKRDTSLSNDGIMKMLHRWEAPLPTEAHRVSFEGISKQKDLLLRPRR